MLIAIEGLDGSGKTTQAKILVNRLNDMGYNAVYIRPVFVLLDLVRINQNKTLSPRISRCAVISIKYEKIVLLKCAIMALIGYVYAIITYLYLIMFYKKIIVVCDRYFYQFFFDLFAEKNNFLITLFPKPHICFYLSCDWEYLHRKMLDDFDKSVGKSYYISAKTFYDKLSKKNGFIEIDARENKQSISNLIFENVMKSLVN